MTARNQKSRVVKGRHKDEESDEPTWTGNSKPPETLQAQRFQEGDAARQERLKTFRDANIAPPGEIPGISPLLEARRLKYGIPDQFFASHPANNRVYVMQMADEDEGMYGGKDGIIHMTESAMERKFQAAPKGIILGGGLKAMDHMYANGYWIGHIVSFVAMSPYRLPVARIGGVEKHVLVMTAGDIGDSYDLSTYLKAGQVVHAHRDYKLADGEVKREFYLQDTKTGLVWDPSTVEMTKEEADGQ